MKSLYALALLTLLAAQASAQARTVFSGIPSIKISEGGLERAPEALPLNKAANLACVISEIGGQYYWASRENRQMVRQESGAFIT